MQRVKKSVMRNIREVKKQKKHQDILNNSIHPAFYVGLGAPRKKVIVKMSKKQKIRYDKKQKVFHVRSAVDIHVAKQQVERERAKEGFSEKQVRRSEKRREMLLKNDSWMDSCTKDNVSTKRKRRQKSLLPSTMRRLRMRRDHSAGGEMDVCVFPFTKLTVVI
jgi:hypothetical protein